MPWRSGSELVGCRLLCRFEHQDGVVDLERRTEFDTQDLYQVGLSEQEKRFAINLLQRCHKYQIIDTDDISRTPTTHTIQTAIHTTIHQGFILFHDFLVSRYILVTTETQVPTSGCRVLEV